MEILTQNLLTHFLVSVLIYDLLELDVVRVCTESLPKYFWRVNGQTFEYVWDGKRLRVVSFFSWWLAHIRLG